jgi:hypothetical protein
VPDPSTVPDRLRFDCPLFVHACFSRLVRNAIPAVSVRTPPLLFLGLAPCLPVIQFEPV